MQTVQKTVKIPQCSSWENCRACCASTVPGRDGADNCVCSAVADLLGPPVLGQVVYMPAVVYFFDKVVEVPVVLCNGVPQELGSSTGDVSGYSGDGTAHCAHLCLAPLGRKSSMRKWRNCTFKYSVRRFSFWSSRGFRRVSPVRGSPGPKNSS